MRRIATLPLRPPPTIAICSRDTTSSSAVSATSVVLRRAALTPAVLLRPPQQPEAEVGANRRDIPEVVPRRRSPSFASRISTTWSPGCESSQHHRPAVANKLYTIQYIQYNTIQYNTIQYNTIQHNTTQHNTTQYNTTMLD